MFGRLNLFLLCVLPLTMMLLGCGVTRIHGDVDVPDAMEGEGDEATVETDEPEAGGAESAVTEKEQETPERETEAEDDKTPKPSTDADAVVLFIKPRNPAELPGGDVVQFIVGFTNTGDKEFTIQSISASLRYPHDYTYFIQNFTEAPFDHSVKPKQQASFAYAFSPSEALHSRPFGLTVLLGYKNEDGKLFENAVFNDTVNIVEVGDGLDGETFFLYLFLAAIVVLLIVGAQQLIKSFGIKRSSKPRQKIEMGTQNSNVDYDWIPKETIQHLNRSPGRSPGRSPKQSPVQRRSKRNARSAGED